VSHCKRFYRCVIPFLLSPTGEDRLLLPLNVCLSFFYCPDMGIKKLRIVTFFLSGRGYLISLLAKTLTRTPHCLLSRPLFCIYVLPPHFFFPAFRIRLVSEILPHPLLPSSRIVSTDSQLAYAPTESSAKARSEGSETDNPEGTPEGVPLNLSQRHGRWMARSRLTPAPPLLVLISLASWPP